MPKKVYINESTLKRIVTEEFLEKKDLQAYIEKDKKLEKKIKKIVADTVSNLFRILWQRRNFYDSDLRN